MLRFSLASLVSVGLVFPAGAAEKGKGDPAGDWMTAQPGRHYQISVADLPEVYATKSDVNRPKVVPRPEGALPRVPEGFTVSLYAEGFKNPRYLLTAANGDILITEGKANKILVLRDADGDGKPETRSEFLGGLNQPFGLAFYPSAEKPEWLYIGNTDGVVRVPYAVGDLKTKGKPEPITDLPGGGHLTGGGHWTRDLAFSSDGKRLFVSVGSKSNVDEKNEAIERKRACIYVMNPDGSDKKLYAEGIRNPVGIAVNPATGELWTSVNERDGLGDDLVPDYITRVREGGFYGWPWSYLGDHPDPRHKKNPRPEMAAKAIVPDVLVQAHSASLNLLFYAGEMFPEKYRGDIFAAFHGSWNRTVPTGYKVIRVPMKDGKAVGGYEDFLTGFVTPKGDVWGRPVGLTVMKDGALLLSEDGNNTLWRITANK